MSKIFLLKNSTGAVRKQKFKRPELTNQIVQALKPKKDEKIVTEDLSKFLKNNKTKPKQYVEILADGRKRTHLNYGYVNQMEAQATLWTFLG